MQVISDIEDTGALCQAWRDNNETIAFVPTMGCLHDGHLSLINAAKMEADKTIVSIFVNPLQFSENEDFSAYPRRLEEDIHKLEDLSPDLIFTPRLQDFYPEGENNVEKIDFGKITTILEGVNRPGHFVGVATVVKRFFDLIQPDSAIFGEKDFQQLLLIKQLTAKFALNIKILGMPTARDSDGLALSSRNAYLTPQERQKAPKIYEILQGIRQELLTGRIDYKILEEEAVNQLEKAGFYPDYVVMRDAEHLSELQHSKNHDIKKVILAAARLGSTRLIDNLRV